jgi:hypothetical protein
LSCENLKASVQQRGETGDRHARAPSMPCGHIARQQIDSGNWASGGQNSPSPQSDDGALATGGGPSLGQDERHTVNIEEPVETSFVACTAQSEPCTASVLFGPVKYAATALLPMKASDVRAMHVALCGHWRLKGRRQGHLKGSAGKADERVSCEWCAASVEGVVLTARALQRLGMLHMCHWQLATLRPADVGACSAGVGTSACTLPHLPIHFALASRGLAIARSAGRTGTGVHAVEQKLEP